MAANPCCCLTLLYGIYILVAVDVAISSSNAVLYGMLLIVVAISQENLGGFLQIGRTEFFILTVTNVASGLFKVGSAVFLLISAHKRHRRACILWWWMNLVCVLLFIFTMFFEFSRTKNTSTLLRGTFVVIFNLYEMTVTHCYVEMLKEGTTAVNPDTPKSVQYQHAPETPVENPVISNS